MSLSEICIRRPVLSWVLTSIVILLGIVGFTRLPLQHKPTVEYPIITIESTLNGASPEVVEAQVTRIIEEALSGIDGIVEMISTSSQETSKVTVEFSPNRRMDDAVNDVRDRLSKAKIQLPHEMEDPTIQRSNADDKPIMTIALTSDKQDPSDLSDLANYDIKNDIEAIDGVAKVEVVGGGLFKMRLKLDPVKLSAHKITVTEVIQAVRQQNIEKPAGKLVSDDREYLVTTNASTESPEEFDLLPIATKEGHIVLLKDIGGAELISDDRKTRTRFNGRPGVSVGIYKQSTSNPVQVARAMRDMIPKIQERLPDDVKFTIGADTSKFIEDAISRLYRTLIEAFLFVTLVVFAFLRSARASIIPLITIPVSLIGSFFFMYLLGFSVNTLTLMAMVLAIGLVVDDAIVVLENIYRRVEEGERPFSAAVKGMREISFAVVAMTLTLAAVYTPFALVQGTIGKTFTEYAVTLAIAVIISGFVALTLSPMMCSRLLGHGEGTYGAKSFAWWAKFKEYFRSDLWLDHAEEKYEELLGRVVQNKKRILTLGVGFSVLGAIAFMGLPREFFPNEDQSRIYISGQAPASSTIDYTDRYVKQIDDILVTIPEVKRRVTTIKNPTYDITVELYADRSRSTEEVIKELKEKLAIVPGVTVKFLGTNGPSDNTNQIQYVVGANKSLREVRELGEIMKDGMYGKRDITSVVMAPPRSDSQEYSITIKRNKSATLGIDPGAIADTIDALVRGRKAGTFKRDNRQYDVIVEVIDAARRTPHDITNLFMKANDRNEKQSVLIPISELVDVQSRSGAVEIYRYNKLRSISQTIYLHKGIGLTEGIEAAENVARDGLPKGARLEFIGETRKYIQESKSIVLIVFLALAFIYFVLAAQFESWIDPLIIIMSVPLSIAGGLLTLMMVKDGTLNVYSQIGLVTLIGLITKHGILMVDFANNLRDNEGIEKAKAIMSACKLRLRPILMTTFAMVLGAVPLAIATGAGTESVRQIGWVIVGGMSFGTTFTLFVLPVIYLYLSPDKRKVLPTVD